MQTSALRRSGGFSMIEVLVSLIIIAVGVLGMVALQSKAIPYTQDSVQRNTAIMLVDDLVGIIRTAGTCTTANNCIKPPQSSFPTAPGSCIPTPTDLSAQIACWAAQASRALPGVTATVLSNSFYICRSLVPGDSQTACGTSNTTNSEVEIQVAWTVKSSAECLDPNLVGTTCTYRIRTRLR
ncbi:type IV pilus modification protein PilV [Pseudomonas abietaniphila]|jgi:type IV pilus assembly protein PilV